ncbi:MAG: class I SAM-dependent methyltransferase [Clostridium sp.]
MAKDRWGEEAKKNTMLYPDERVAVFLGRNFKPIENNFGKKSIDIGCGSGRHMKILADYGFDVYGIDCSKEAVKVAKDVLGDNENIKEIIADDFVNLKIVNEFDCIIAYGLMMYKTMEETKKDLMQFKDMLKPGGKILVNFRNYDNWFLKYSEKIGEGLYALKSGAKEYEGINYFVCSCEEAVTMIKDVGLKIIDTERIDYWKRNSTERNSWEIFVLEK